MVEIFINPKYHRIDWLTERGSGGVELESKEQYNKKLLSLIKKYSHFAREIIIKEVLTK